MKNFLMPIAAAALGVAICVGLFIYSFGDSSKASPGVQAAAVPSAPAADPQRAAQCKKLLKSAPSGSWRSYKMSGDGFGTVVVGATFYAAPFEGKEAMDSVFRCILSEGRADNAGVDYVEYLDPYTHKEVAKWSKYTGFSVD